MIDIELEYHYNPLRISPEELIEICNEVDAALANALSKLKRKRV